MFILLQQKAAFEDVCGIKLGYKMRLYGFAGCEHALYPIRTNRNVWVTDQMIHASFARFRRGIDL
jgi:hypothetical protein